MRMRPIPGRRALARLPFLLLAACGLWLIGQGADIPAKAWLAQILLERAFAAKPRHAASRPGPGPGPTRRRSRKIRVPRLGVEEIVLSGGSGEAMAFGPTLLPGGGRLGERGTAVFAAHRDTHFRFLRDLRPGDVIEVEEIDRPHTALPRRRRAGWSATTPSPSTATPPAPRSRSRPAGRSAAPGAARCATSSRPNCCFSRPAASRPRAPARDCRDR